MRTRTISGGLSMDSRGQMTIEMILIMIILLSLALTISRTARSEGYVASLVEGPWLHLRGMIEDGVWERAGEKSKKQHPSQLDRHGSDRGHDMPQS